MMPQLIRTELFFTKRKSNEKKHIRGGLPVYGFTAEY